MGTNGPTAPTGPARKGRPRKRKSPLVTARTVTGGECGASGVLESGGAQSVVTATQLNGTQQSQGMMGQLSAGEKSPPSYAFRFFFYFKDRAADGPHVVLSSPALACPRQAPLLTLTLAERLVT